MANTSIVSFVMEPNRLPGSHILLSWSNKLEIVLLLSSLSQLVQVLLARGVILNSMD